MIDTNVTGEQLIREPTPLNTLQPCQGTAEMRQEDLIYTAATWGPVRAGAVEEL